MDARWRIIRDATTGKINDDTHGADTDTNDNDNETDTGDSTTVKINQEIY